LFLLSIRISGSLAFGSQVTGISSKNIFFLNTWLHRPNLVRRVLTALGRCCEAGGGLTWLLFPAWNWRDIDAADGLIPEQKLPCRRRCEFFNFHQITDNGVNKATT
jgi:hypothetical protein